MSQTPIQLSPAAVTRIQHLMEKEKGILGLRVGVTVKGCNGFVHTLDYAKKIHEGDIRVEQDGVVVFISPEALPIVQGTTLDWIEEELEQRFTFKNPNAKGTCGCGESFHV